MLELPLTSILALVAGYLFIKVVEARRRYVNVPAVGGSGLFTQFTAASAFVKNAAAVTQQGYDKHKVFKVPEPQRWHVLITQKEHIDELRHARDDVLSFPAAIQDDMSSDVIFGTEAAEGYHVGVIKSQLTRNLPALFDDVRDEVVQGFEQIINAKENEWIKFNGLRTVQHIVCRAANRIFVGLPLCRDPEWIDLNIRFTIDVSKGADFLRYIPKLFKPIAALFYDNVRRSIKQGLRLLGPEIERRKKMLEEYGPDYEGKPNDMLTWLMDAAQGKDRETRELVLRILNVNFAAIHTSSNSFANALFHLAAQPEYLEPIRQEVEECTQRDGWSKLGLAKMRKLDSFLRESQRVNSLSILSMTRKVLQPFTFKDGTYLPKGVFVSIPAISIHNDPKLYEHPEKFEPFRFAEMRDEEGESTKYQMVATSHDYLPFGHGKHACPGRFFAAQELKLMMAHLVLNYEVKFENEGVRPPNLTFGSTTLANPMAEVMIRKRRV